MRIRAERIDPNTCAHEKLAHVADISGSSVFASEEVIAAHCRECGAGLIATIYGDDRDTALRPMTAMEVSTYGEGKPVFA